MKIEKTIIGRINKTVAFWGIGGAVKLIFGSRFKSFRGKGYESLMRERQLIESIIQAGYYICRTLNGYMVSNHEKSINIFCRKASSDLNVFIQIFVDDEFKHLFDLIKLKEIKINTIIDAGGNIGLSSVKFSLNFPGSKILTIEPDSSNFAALTRNLEVNNVNAALFKYGLWNKTCKLYFDRSFRDGKDWSISLSEDPVSEDFVDAISIDDLIAQQGLNSVDLLKVDIEGGERFIFDSNNSAMEFLHNTKVIAIEIHEEFNIYNSVINLLETYNYEISQSGEYVIGFKKY